MRSLDRKACINRGFTLLELLVAAAITIALVGMLLVVAQMVLKSWQQVSGKWSAAGVAIPALDQIQRDLEAAVDPPGDGAFLAVTILRDTANSGSGNWINPSRFSKPTTDVVIAGAIDECRFGATTWLRFFIGFEGTSGDGAATRATVRAVSYQIVRRPLSGSSGEAGYLLFRGLVSGSNTLTAGGDILSGNYQAQNATEGNVGNVRRPNANQVIADNVVDFGIRLYARRAEGLVPLFPANGGEWSAGSLQFEMRGNSTLEMTPVLAEIMVRVLTDEGVQKLKVFEDSSSLGPLPTSWWDFVEAHSHAFVRRVWLMRGR